MAETDPNQTVGACYARVRTRLAALLEEIDPADWDAPVDACPGWRVREVIAHLLGNVEDDPRDLLALWAPAAELSEPAMTRSEMWPAFFDVLSHEHDLRHALGRGGEQENDDEVLAATRLADPIVVPGGVIELAIGDAVATPRVGAGQTYLLRAPAFGIFRLRLGRRSVDQVRAMNWSQDPTPVLGRLFAFGPRGVPLIE